MQAVSGSISWAILDARESAKSTTLLNERILAFAEARRLADPNLNEKEIALVRDNKKIAAIREYRVRTGIGLYDAKDAVEGWMLKNLGYVNKPHQRNGIGT